MKSLALSLIAIIMIHWSYAQDFNNEKESLNIFVGDWKIQGSVSEDFAGSQGPVTGSTTYFWDLGNSWLRFESTLIIPGVGEYVVHGGVAFNSHTNTFDAYSINNIGFMIIYVGEWVKNKLVFTQSYPLPGGDSRVVYEITGNAVTMISERKNESGKFRSYYESKLSRKP